MTLHTQLLLMLAWCLVAGCRAGPNTNVPARISKAPASAKAEAAWLGVHVLINNNREIAVLEEQLPQLAAVGVNALILEVDYNFEFKSHPELSSPGAVRLASAHHLAASARKFGIRLIPELNCLGHQSWKQTTLALLSKHPEFDETPGQFPENAAIYCRSWCPQNPEVNQVVFALIDELADAFEAHAFHVGMDEVFLIASKYCPRCHDQDPAKLFARAVKDLHGHIVGRRKLQMLMWGDRLLDAQAMHGGEWEYAKNGTSGAVELIPKDIIVCDWHYGTQTNYPSVPFLLKKGFRVWPASWQPLTAAQAFSKFSRQQEDPRLLGFLCTVWGKETIENIAEWPPIVDVLAEWKDYQTLRAADAGHPVVPAANQNHTPRL